MKRKIAALLVVSLCAIMVRTSYAKINNEIVQPFNSDSQDESSPAGADAGDDIVLPAVLLAAEVVAVAVEVGTLVYRLLRSAGMEEPAAALLKFPGLQQDQLFDLRA